MKELFPGFYRPSKAEFDRLWREGWFVLDANVLLNLYRYRAEARADYLNVLGQIAARTWIPHQAALEFQMNRVETIAKQDGSFSRVAKQISAFREFLLSNRDQLRTVIGTKELHDAVEPHVAAFEQRLEELRAQQITADGDDPVRDALDGLLAKVIGEAFSQKDLDSLYAEGKQRYELNTPPGYEDAKKDGSFMYGGRVYARAYGDWILWRQVLDWAKTNKVRCLILVTDDRKGDWWQANPNKPNETIGPRPELAAEMQVFAGVELFHMYEPGGFLRYAKANLGASVRDESIVEVGSVTAEDKQREQVPTIVFTGDAGTDFDHHAFQFSAYVNGDLKWCVIAQETVEDYFNLSSDARHDEAWETFRKNRRKIEAAAREAIKNYRFWPDGRTRVGLEELAATDAASRLAALRQRTRILVEQARELATLLKQPGTGFRNAKGDDLDGLIEEASAAHEVVTELRSNVPEVIDLVEWERTQIEDGRTGEDIFERLGDLVHDLIREKRRGGR